MKSVKKIFVIYPLVVMLILGGMFAANGDFLYAAVSFDVSQSTRWVQGQNINSGMRIKTKSGTIAYCLSQGRSRPSGSYSDKMTLSSKLKAVLYYGYPNNKKFGSISLTADQARCATQLAVWAHDTSGKGNQIDLDKLHGAYDKAPAGDNVLKAAKWLYKKAASGYDAPPKPTFQTPTISKPSNSTPQYFNNAYVRIGPYRFTTTSNSYTSDNKVSVDLKGAPAGTKLGNGTGSFISIPSAGSDFYLYIPSSNLGKKGSGKFSMSVSYKYKFEKTPSFSAYKKSNTQDVAISIKKEYTSGSKSVSAIGNFEWTVGKLRKVNSADKEKVIADTEFDLYYDPTPTNTGNDDWKFIRKMKTDASGIINIPGLGIGTYKLVETKPNSDYAFNKEFGGSDEMIFKITDVSKEQIQVMTNELINVSCQVDKDTIKKTSAAYRSLPDQEGFDNVGNEAYRYHVDYRSTSNVFADEFTLDDPLEGVSAGQIRVSELWTPVSYGDYDGKMNIWYKTNMTDDNVDYSDASAMSSNPSNPNNMNSYPVKKNTGYKLWKKDTGTTARVHLSIADLNLDEDEYITAIRLEHGRVERGFTTRNTAYDSMNDDSIEDWTPKQTDHYYSKGGAEATGLKPLTYLVTCPKPLTPPAVIDNSANAFIARNIDLTDDDLDKVSTEVINTFKENPVNEEYNEPPCGGEDEYPPGEFEEPKETEKVLGEEAKTGDAFRLSIILIFMVGAGIVVFALKKRNKIKMLSLLLAGMLIAGTAASFDNAYASGYPMSDSFTKNGMEYSLATASKVEPAANETIYNVEYHVDQNVNKKIIDNVDQYQILPQKVEVSIREYNGKIMLANKNIKPIYLKKQVQIDKIEVIENLDAEDVSELPDSKVYTVRSDKAIGGTEEKELKRAGVSLKVSDMDDDGVPIKWNATIVYRGLESYLEKYQYNVKATYSGMVSASAKQVDATAPVIEKDYNDLTYEEARERNEELAKEKYLEFKGDGSSASSHKAVPEADGWQTSDFIKFLGLILALAVISFITYMILTRNRQKRIG